MSMKLNHFPFSLDNKRYHTLNYYNKNKFGIKVHKAVLECGFTCPNIDGSKGVGGCVFCDGGSGYFRELYTALLDGASWHEPDHYYLLGDMRSYVEAKLKAISDYSNDRAAFARKQWLNMCNAGKFSSDRTIADYAENIWKL